MTKDAVKVVPASRVVTCVMLDTDRNTSGIKSYEILGSRGGV